MKIKALLLMLLVFCLFASACTEAVDKDKSEESSATIAGESSVEEDTLTKEGTEEPVASETTEETLPEETSDPSLSEDSGDGLIYAPLLFGEEFVEGFSCGRYNDTGAYTSSVLLGLLEEYQGQDVKYRLFVEVMASGNSNIEAAFKFIEESGAEDIEAVPNYADIVAWSVNCRYLSADEAVVYKLLENAELAVTAAPPKRVKGYSVAVTDMLTVMLSRAEDDDEFTVWVETTADYKNNYLKFLRDSFENYCVAKRLDFENHESWSYPKNWQTDEGAFIVLMTWKMYANAYNLYRRDVMGELYYGGVNMANPPEDAVYAFQNDPEGATRAMEELPQVVEAYMNGIIEKAAIKDKVNLNDYTVLVGDTDYAIHHKKIGQYVLTGGTVEDRYLLCPLLGFEATLTKAEILKLAEDENIRAIFSADIGAALYSPAPYPGWYTSWTEDDKFVK